MRIIHRSDALDFLNSLQEIFSHIINYVQKAGEQTIFHRNLLKTFCQITKIVILLLGSRLIFYQSENFSESKKYYKKKFLRKYYDWFSNKRTKKISFTCCCCILTYAGSVLYSGWTYQSVYYSKRVRNILQHHHCIHRSLSFSKKDSRHYSSNIQCSDHNVCTVLLHIRCNTIIFRTGLFCDTHIYDYSGFRSVETVHHSVLRRLNQIFQKWHHFRFSEVKNSAAGKFHNSAYQMQAFSRWVDSENQRLFRSIFSYRISNLHSAINPWTVDIPPNFF